MELTAVRLLPVTLQLKQPFCSAHETVRTREITLIQVTDEMGHQGIGELESFTTPYYVAETQATSRSILTKTLIPLLKGKTLATPLDVQAVWQPVAGFQMAQAALETALWDLWARRQGQSLAACLAQQLQCNVQTQTPVGISLGASATPEVTVAQVTAAVHQGYQRVKLKVTQPADLARVQAVRQAFPNLQLLVDANSAFTTADLDFLQQLDQLDLALIEEPLPVTDLVGKQWLQQRLRTPICLDESVATLADLTTANALGAGQVLNLKLARVGGLGPALAMIRWAKQHHWPVWCGGMLEGGIGRATALALASLPVFQLPSDLAASAHYYQADLLTTDFKLTHGALTVPTGPGLGVALQPIWQQRLAQQANILDRF